MGSDARGCSSVGLTCRVLKTDSSQLPTLKFWGDSGGKRSTILTLLEKVLQGPRRRAGHRVLHCWSVSLPGPVLAVVGTVVKEVLRAAAVEEGRHGAASEKCFGGVGTYSGVFRAASPEKLAQAHT